MKMTNTKSGTISIDLMQASLMIFMVLFLSAAVNAQTTLFSFEATLPNDVAPATDVYEMEFRLFGAASGGSQIGTPNAVSAVDVKNRAFTVWLDFGAAAFPGADRFIEISYRRSGSNQPFTIVSPREPVLSVPYAIRALTAGTADNALNLNGVPASDYVQTTDPRLSDDRDPLPGSNNYIQNTTAPQSPADFNISGTGTANIFNSATQYNLGGSRILSSPITNLFVGRGAGTANTSGFQNVFVGGSAGNSNTTGRDNSYFGISAGSANSTGQSNSFFGSFAGRNTANSSNNTFFGASAGQGTTAGSENTFVGRGAGLNHSVGRGNTMIGDLSGFSGASTVLNVNNTLVGSNTRVDPGVFNSTAIGTGATVTATNTIVLGTNAQTILIPGGSVKTFNDNSFTGMIVNNMLVRDLARFTPTSTSPVCFRFVTVQTSTGPDAGYSLTNCDTTSSLASKSDVEPFTGGLDIIKRLKPVAFRWKGDGSSDLGLNAEDVAEVAPQLIRRSDKGEAGAVNPNSFNVLFINAFKEQQKQIEAQQKRLDTQLQQINALKRLVCRTNAQAEICK